MAKTQQAGAETPAELTLEQAVAQIKALEESNAVLTTENTELKSDVETLKGEGEKLANQVKDLEAELKDSAAIVTDLKEQLAEASQGKKKGPIVKIGNDTFRIVGGTVIDKKPHSPEDLAADSKLCAKLIKRGSKLFQKTN